MKVGIYIALVFSVAINAVALISIANDEQKPVEELSIYEKSGYKLHMAGMHPTLEVNSDFIPSLSAQFQQDQKGGYNVILSLDNFQFAPEKASTDDQTQNEGHAHLIINGYKITRLYSTNYYLPQNLLHEGDNIVRIFLNANDHSDWQFDGQPIVHEERITVD